MGKSNLTVFAAIDVGSNTVRLLLADIESDKLLPRRYVRRITRLRGGMTTEQGLAANSRQRTLEALREFTEICRQEKVLEIKAVATAAFRQACNGHQFAKEIHRVTGLPLEIIPGSEEARLTALGVLSVLDPIPKHVLIVDIGGASTEFVLHSCGRPVWLASRPFGVVSLTESYRDTQVRRHHINQELAAVGNELAQQCNALSLCFSDLALVGTAGTVTTLAALDQKMDSYDWRRVNNSRLDKLTIHHLYNTLAPLTLEQRECLPGVERGRGDLIVTGIETVLSTMDMIGANELLVSDFGILEGCLLSLAEGE
ncbi:MAG: exopolyphosphatase [Deltaproteobacteria bacterium]|nr:exopolyphosphatase [Deltaproteobacteria bacterium]